MCISVWVQSLSLADIVKALQRLGHAQTQHNQLFIAPKCNHYIQYTNLHTEKNIQSYIHIFVCTKTSITIPTKMYNMFAMPMNEMQCE
jgi:uncharacterized protein (AIM24 family)